ncbi:MAG: hypothetical protein FWF08_08840 [Oscillospiraceae bacterium]|nr:hypothetical protein [Oscillospiraceae bacterium]
MNEEKKEITLPREVQRQMMKFFLSTSIPRIKREKELLLSENKTDGSSEE